MKLGHWWVDGAVFLNCDKLNATQDLYNNIIIIYLETTSILTIIAIYNKQRDIKSNKFCNVILYEH